MVERRGRILVVGLVVMGAGGCGNGSYQGSGGTGAGAGVGAGAGATSGIPSASGGINSGVFAGTGFTESGASTGYPSVDAGLDAQAFCKVPAIDAGSLPFVVDTVYHPTGWMGDAPAYPAQPAAPGLPASPATTARMTLAPTNYSTIGDACTPDGVGRSTANAKGACWKVTYIPFPRAVEPGPAPGMTTIGNAPRNGWAGAFWQYPLNNWGNLGGGYPIPPGATTVSFWARGREGGEKVQFFTGQGQGGPLAKGDKPEPVLLQAISCSDYVATTSVDSVLPNPPDWKHIAIDITGLDYSTANIAPGQGLNGYFGGVIGAFGFSVDDQTLPSLDGGSAPPNETDPDGGPVIDPFVPDAAFPPFFDSTIVFYIDDIEFQ